VDGARDRKGDASIVRIVGTARLLCHESGRRLIHHRRDRNGDVPVVLNGATLPRKRATATAQKHMLRATRLRRGSTTPGCT
jgi:hypothetical protein